MSYAENLRNRFMSDQIINTESQSEDSSSDSTSNDENQRMDINLIRHKLYKSYDDNKTLRIARELKPAPFQESNCKRVLVFDEYSCDSEKEIMQNKFYQSQTQNPNYHNARNSPNLRYGNVENQQALKPIGHDPQISLMESEIQTLKACYIESQERESLVDTRLRKLEMELLDFKTNITNYLLGASAQAPVTRDAQPVSEPVKPVQKKPQHRYTKSQMGGGYLDGTRKEIYEELCRENEILERKPNNQNPGQEKYHGKVYKGIVMPSTNSNSLENEEKKKPVKYFTQVSHNDSEVIEDGDSDIPNQNQDNQELKSENVKLKAEILKLSNTINHIITDKDWKRPAKEPKKKVSKSKPKKHFKKAPPFEAFAATTNLPQPLPENSHMTSATRQELKALEQEHKKFQDYQAQKKLQKTSKNSADQHGNPQQPTLHKPNQNAAQTQRPKKSRQLSMGIIKSEISPDQGRRFPTENSMENFQKDTKQEESLALKRP